MQLMIKNQANINTQIRLRT